MVWVVGGREQGLLDIVTSFTRAAGAAQRVFALMDSMPVSYPRQGPGLRAREQVQGSERGIQASGLGARGSGGGEVVVGN